MSEIKFRLWERAEVAMTTEFTTSKGPGVPLHAMAKAAVVAVLRELSDEVYVAEEDDNTEWPGSWDLEKLADDLEAVSDGD